MEQHAVHPFGAWLKRRRKALDLRQDDLAALVGCAMMTIQKIECGERRPSRQLAELLAIQFQIPLDERPAFIRFARSMLPAVQPALSVHAADTAPWRSMHRQHTNIPVLPTPLIGRMQDVAGVVDMLRRDRVRIVTLVGPPGIGKTSLAVEVATALLDDFTDGVRFVTLATICDTELVLQAIAQTLSIKDSGNQPLLEHMKANLGNKRILLLLDNFEQVLAAAPLIAELLAACPWMKVLVTSRAALQLRGERLYHVPSLALPNLAQRMTTEAVAAAPAVALFLERAQAVKPDFELTEHNAGMVADICLRLDGVPLAIELAAARIQLLSPQMLLARLDRRLTLLSGGACDLPARQQTLRAAIDWSYALLSAEEQALFRRLGVFVGGCTLEAAEAVCTAVADQPLDVLDGLQALVNQSLLRQDVGVEGEPRFSMLETIREYAWEQLVASGEAPSVGKRHALFYVRLAEQAEAELQRLDQVMWLQRLEVEHGNLRAALQWTLDQQETEMALRLSAALGVFWDVRGHLAEGRRWLEQALALQGLTQASRTRQAKAIHALGILTRSQSMYDAAYCLLVDSLALYQEAGDKQGVADTVYALGEVAHRQGNATESHRLWMESLALYEEIGDKRGAAWSLKWVAWQNDAGLLEKSLAIFKELGERRGIADVLNAMGENMRAAGEYERAAALYQESLAIRRELGDKWHIAQSLLNLGKVLCNQGKPVQSRALLTEMLEICQELGIAHAVADCLAGLGGVAVIMGQPERAVRLFGVTASLLHASGAALDDTDNADYERYVADARLRLSEVAFAGSWANGLAMSLDQVIAYALDADSKE